MGSDSKSFPNNGKQVRTDAEYYFPIIAQMRLVLYYGLTQLIIISISGFFLVNCWQVAGMSFQ